MLVEVCANSLESALHAQSAGADRIELCVELGVGGITPSQGLIASALEQLSIPVHVLIRPRSGHFTYSQTEFEVMQQDIVFCKTLGVQGVVSGILLADGTLDVPRTNVLVTLAGPMHFVFHRAFDWVTDPVATLVQLQHIGVRTVLTSGQCISAAEGIERISEWQKTTTISLMAGGGITDNNAVQFKMAGLPAIHLSGTTFVNAVPTDGKIPMNSQKHLQEHQVAVTNETVIRHIVQTVK